MTLRDDILSFISRAYAAPHDAAPHNAAPNTTVWPDSAATRAEFEALAVRALAYQAERCAPYADYVRKSRGRIDDPWRAPPLPTDALKLRRIAAFPASEDVACFVSSGTTQADRSLHPIRDLEAARAPLVAPFCHYMLPDHAKMRMLILAPPFADAPTSSLYFMLDTLRAACGTPQSAHAIQADGTIDTALIESTFAQAIARHEPLFLLGPSFAFVHLLDRLNTAQTRYALPAGSRVFETGGFKGQSRTVPRPELHAAIHNALGIPPQQIAAEYGMSELSSQLYEPVLRAANAPRLYMPPPWCGVQVLDPDTLVPLPCGEIGLISFLDLANFDTITALLTADLGRLHIAPSNTPAPCGWHGLPERCVGLELLGRASTASAKGCSLAIDMLVNSNH